MGWMMASAAVAALLAAGPAMAQTARFGYVDLQRALNESRAGKEAKGRFAKRVEEAQKVVDARQEELRKLQADLDKQSLLLREDALAEKRKQFEMKRRDFQRNVKDSQDELQVEERDLTTRILADLEKIVAKIGQDEGYALIFERSKSSILFARETIDLTNRVIETYDRQPAK